MSHENLDEELFQSLEQQLHRPEFRTSHQTVSALLADDFIEFGSSGRVYDKSITVEALAEEAVSDNSPVPEVYDFTVKSISSDAVLVTYRSRRQPTATWEGRQTLRSSIWKMIDGRWQMLFHQGTVIPTE